MPVSMQSKLSSKRTTMIQVLSHRVTRTRALLLETMQQKTNCCSWLAKGTCATSTAYLSKMTSCLHSLDNQTWGYLKQSRSKISSQDLYLKNSINHLTRKMASMQLPLQQFIGDVRKSLTCTSVSESFSRLTSFSIRRSILNEILFTCTVPFVLIERLAVTPASLKSNRTVAMVYKLWMDMLKNPKATRDSKKNKKEKMQTKKKRVGRKEVKTPSTVSDSN